jgi:hypothetical protein
MKPGAYLFLWKMGQFVLLLALSACAGGLLLEHRLAYSHPGTAAEVRHGYLILGGYYVPDVFSFVQQEGAAWVFITQSERGGNAGYHEAFRVSNIRPSGSMIESAALLQGWYVGHTLHEGTPRGWLHVLWSDNRAAAFVAPNALNRFVVENRLPILPRKENPPALFESQLRTGADEL